MNGFVWRVSYRLRGSRFLSKTATPVKRMLGDGDLPERVDPRRSALANRGCCKLKTSCKLAVAKANPSPKALSYATPSRRGE